MEKRGRPFTILVIGRVGTGKSEMTKAMFKADTKVGHRSASIKSERILEAKVILDVVKLCDHFDVILICAKFKGEAADHRMFSKLASILNKEMWKRTIVALTFANMLTQLGTVKKSTDIKTCEIFHSVAGEKDEAKLTTVDDWLVALWDKCIDCYSTGAGIGATIGFAIPGPGTAIGAGVGSAMGTSVGFVITKLC
uniref:AIG1-type G domain-containing protein n=1 Tax=Amphimedon queenslandica TaxID=400682 RepID=A0A1X7TV42_AMPQE